MFEYWFYGHGDTVHHGATNDWLQVCADIAKCYDTQTLGWFMIAMFTEHSDKLEVLRVTDWNFEFTWTDPDPTQEIALGDGQEIHMIEKKIELRKLR